MEDEDMRSVMYEDLTRFLTVILQFSRQNRLSRAFASCWCRKHGWHAAGRPVLVRFTTRVLYRNSDKIRLKWLIKFWHHWLSLRSLWTRFLLPDICQVLFHCFAGCIDLPRPSERSNVATFLSVFISSTMWNFLSLKVGGYLEPNLYFDPLIVG